VGTAAQVTLLHPGSQRCLRCCRVPYDSALGEVGPSSGAMPLSPACGTPGGDRSLRRPFARAECRSRYSRATCRFGQLARRRGLRRRRRLLRRPGCRWRRPGCAAAPPRRSASRARGGRGARFRIAVHTGSSKASRCTRLEATWAPRLKNHRALRAHGRQLPDRARRPPRRCPVAASAQWPRGARLSLGMPAPAPRSPQSAPVTRGGSRRRWSSVWFSQGFSGEVLRAGEPW
jgi:hypothetical protein